MPFNIDAALGIHAHALTLRARRAEVLAANLANSDTPGYQARDLDFRAALGNARADREPNAIRLSTRHAAHLQTEGASLPGGELKYRVPSQPSIDGNTVDPQIEYAAFAENALRYQASLTFLGGRIKTLLTAIRGD
jgi:flagellar basal-body rod protein FlgB